VSAPPLVAASVSVPQEAVPEIRVPAQLPAMTTVQAPAPRAPTKFQIAAVHKAVHDTLVVAGFDVQRTPGGGARWNNWMVIPSNICTLCSKPPKGCMCLK
jgi:hypothetical protein